MSVNKQPEYNRPWNIWRCMLCSGVVLLWDEDGSLLTRSWSSWRLWWRQCCKTTMIMTRIMTLLLMMVGMLMTVTKMMTTMTMAVTVAGHKEISNEVTSVCKLFWYQDKWSIENLVDHLMYAFADINKYVCKISRKLVPKMCIRDTLNTTYRLVKNYVTELQEQTNMNKKWTSIKHGYTQTHRYEQIPTDKQTIALRPTQINTGKQ